VQHTSRNYRTLERALPEHSEPFKCYDPSVDLDDFADSATPDVTVSEDVDLPMLHEVTRAIRRLKNGRAAGADGITAKLLKGAKKPISEALHKVVISVWSTGRVPAERKEGIIVSLTRAKDHSLSVVVTGRSLFCLNREKYLHISFWRAFNLYLTSVADLNSLVLLLVGLLWMSY